MDLSSEPKAAEDGDSNPNQSLPEENAPSNDSNEQLQTSKNNIQTSAASFVASNHKVAPKVMSEPGSLPFQPQERKRRAGRKHNRTLKKLKNTNTLNSVPFAGKRYPYYPNIQKVFLKREEENNVKVQISMPTDLYRQTLAMGSLPHMNTLLYPFTNSNFSLMNNSYRPSQIWPTNVNSRNFMAPNVTGIVPKSFKTNRGFEGEKHKKDEKKDDYNTRMNVTHVNMQNQNLNDNVKMDELRSKLEKNEENKVCAASSNLKFQSLNKGNEVLNPNCREFLMKENSKTECPGASVASNINAGERMMTTGAEAPLLGKRKRHRAGRKHDRTRKRMQRQQQENYVETLRKPEMANTAFDEQCRPIKNSNYEYCQQQY